jgi:cholesterol transport system auxiliary component
MKSLLLAAILAGTAALSGCGGGILAPSGPPAKLYTVSAPATVETTAPVAKWQLLIDVPNAILDLNTDRIAVKPEPARIDYYAGVAWADRPPTLLQELLLQSFAKSGHIAAVARQSGGLKADFVLSTDLQDFQVEADPGAPEVHVTITARLIRGRDQEIVASRTFEARLPADGGFDGAIATFGQALNQMLPQIVDWTLVQGSRNQ